MLQWLPCLASFKTGLHTRFYRQFVAEFDWCRIWHFDAELSGAYRTNDMRSRGRFFFGFRRWTV